MLPNEPTVRQKKGNYYLVFYDSDRSPKQKWVPLRTTTKRTATARARPLIERYMRGVLDPWIEDPHATIPEIQDALQQFLDDRKGELSHRTWRTYKYDLDPLAESLRGTRLDHIDPSLVASWARRGDVSNRTIEKRLTEAGTFFQYFVNRGVIDSNPTDTLSTPRVETSPPRWLTETEYARLVAVIRQYADDYDDPTVDRPQQQASRRWLLYGVQLAVSTGLRRGSLIALRWGHIGPERITVPAQASKRDGYTVPLFDRTRAVLTQIGTETGRVLTRPDGSRIPPRMFTRQYNRFAEQADLEDTSLHTLRHTFASWLVQASVPLYKVSNWMGHHSVTVTERYAHLAPDQNDPRADAVFGD